MIFRGYGVTLTRLQHKDIELVRQHRNSSYVQQFMEFREEISKADQEKWFLSINNKHNNYFLISHNEETIGLIYGAGLDWEKKETANGGIFIWSEKFLETEATLGASLMLTEISFLIGLERTYIKVLRDNSRAISFNKNLGYEIMPGQEQIKNQRYILTKTNFLSKAKRICEYFIHRYGEVFEIHFDHSEDESEARWIEACNAATEQDKKRMKLIIG